MDQFTRASKAPQKVEPGSDKPVGLREKSEAEKAKADRRRRLSGIVGKMHKKIRAAEARVAYEARLARVVGRAKDE